MDSQQVFDITLTFGRGSHWSILLDACLWYRTVRNEHYYRESSWTMACS